MGSIAQVSETMQTILTSRAKAVERETGFVSRSTVHLDGPIFSQTAVLTWMHTPQASYSQLRHTGLMATLGHEPRNSQMYTKLTNLIEVLQVLHLWISRIRSSAIGGVPR